MEKFLCLTNHKKSHKNKLNDPPIAPAKRKGNIKECQVRGKKTKVVDEQPETSCVTTRS